MSAIDSCAGCALHKDVLATEVSRAVTQSMFHPKLCTGGLHLPEKKVSFFLFSPRYDPLSKLCLQASA